MNIMDMFKAIILVQLFYAIAISIIVYSLPASAIDYTNAFSDAGNQIDIEDINSDVQDSLTSQTDIPVIEIGALVFYSGNILIDLLLNFITAIPQMFMLLINGILMLLGNGLDGQILLYVESFVTVFIGIMYVIGLMQLLTGIRSGRLV